jgi:hypothetical protein
VYRGVARQFLIERTPQNFDECLTHGSNPG